MNNFKPHDYNAVCDVCGFEFKASKLVKRWDGMMVCKDDFERRHPQELLRARPETARPPWTRPEGEDRFVEVGPANPEDL